MKEKTSSDPVGIGKEPSVSQKKPIDGGNTDSSPPPPKITEDGDDCSLDSTRPDPNTGNQILTFLCGTEYTQVEIPPGKPGAPGHSCKVFGLQKKDDEHLLIMQCGSQKTIIPLPKGDKGERGERGEKGERGDTGPKGESCKVIAGSKTTDGRAYRIIFACGNQRVTFEVPLSPEYESEVQKRACFWSPYLNDFDKDLNFSCPGNSVMSGIASYHNSHHEDRRTRVQCCYLRIKPKTD